MKKVATVRVVKDCCHGEPGMEGNQGDQLNANKCDLIQLNECSKDTHDKVNVLLPRSQGSCSWLPN